jgi:hypothetical protein
VRRYDNSRPPTLFSKLNPAPPVADAGEDLLFFKLFPSEKSCVFHIYSKSLPTLIQQQKVIYGFFGTGCPTMNTIAEEF